MVCAKEIGVEIEDGILKKVKFFVFIFTSKYPFGGEHGNGKEKWQREKRS